MFQNPLQDILFEVDIFNTQDLLPAYKHQSENSRVIIDKTNDRILNFCSPQYQLERNADFILPVYNELSKLFEVEVETRIEHHARFFVDFIIKNRDLEILPKDKINPCISFQNSYNNSLRRVVSFGYSRLICSNGLRAFETVGDFTRKHTGEFKLQMERVYDFIESLHSHKNRFKVLTDRQLSKEEAQRIIQSVEANPKIEYPKRLIEDVLPVAQKEAQTLELPLSNWLLYNGFNHGLSHADIKLPFDQRKKIDRQVLKFLINV